MGRRSNKDISSENQEEFVSQLTASTPEGRENEMIMLAYQEVERRIRDHTATSQELCHFLKMGSEKERLEREKLEVEMELQRVRADSIESALTLCNSISTSSFSLSSLSFSEPIFKK